MKKLNGINIVVAKHDKICSFGRRYFSQIFAVSQNCHLFRHIFRKHFGLRGRNFSGRLKRLFGAPIISEIHCRRLVRFSRQIKVAPIYTHIVTFLLKNRLFYRSGFQKRKSVFFYLFKTNFLAIIVHGPLRCRFEINLNIMRRIIARFHLISQI